MDQLKFRFLDMGCQNNQYFISNLQISQRCVDTAVRQFSGNAVRWHDLNVRRAPQQSER